MNEDEMKTNEDFQDGMSSPGGDNSSSARDVNHGTRNNELNSSLSYGDVVLMIWNRIKFNERIPQKF